MYASFEPFPVLTTPSLFLRAVTRHDVNEVFFLRSDDTVLRYINKPPAKALADAEEFIDRITRQQQNNECITWALVVKGETDMIGSICLWNLEPANSKAEVGYAMHPDYFGRGYMYEAMTAILDYGFKTMQLKIVEGITNAGNTRSRRLLERAGFTRDAQLELERIGTEEPEDATIYSLKK